MKRLWWKRLLHHIGIHVGCCWYVMSEDEQIGRGMWSGAPPDDF